MLHITVPPRKKKASIASIKKAKRRNARKKIKSLQLRLGEKINQIAKLYKSFLAR